MTIVVEKKDGNFWKDENLKTFYHLKIFNSSMDKCREEKPVVEIGIEISVQHFSIAKR